jgi:hypothetical protein
MTIERIEFDPQLGERAAIKRPGRRVGRLLAVDSLEVRRLQVDNEPVFLAGPFHGGVVVLDSRASLARIREVFGGDACAAVGALLDEVDPLGAWAAAESTR